MNKIMYSAMKSIIFALGLLVGSVSSAAPPVRCAGVFALSQRGLESNFRQLVKLGYSPSVAKKIAPLDPAWIQSSSKTSRPHIVRRGFQGDWRNYDPKFRKGAVWISPGTTPLGYASGIETGRSSKLYYALEYEIPRGLLKTQYGEFGQPQSRPPYHGEWGFFDREDIPNELPYIRKVYFPRSVELESGYPTKGAGWYEFNFEDVFSPDGVYLGPRGKEPLNQNGEINNPPEWEKYTPQYLRKK